MNQSFQQEAWIRVQTDGVLFSFIAMSSIDSGYEYIIPFDI